VLLSLVCDLEAPSDDTMHGKTKENMHGQEGLVSEGAGVIELACMAMFCFSLQNVCPQPFWLKHFKIL